MADQRLVNFIKEARKKGYEDWQIREPLLKKGWPEQEVDKAFAIVHQSMKPKTKICVYLDNEIIKLLEKRAKRNILTLPDQIEDILRRSCLGMKKPQVKEKIDDALVSLFSRRKYGKK
jgi:hypothetical protein